MLSSHFLRFLRLLLLRFFRWTWAIPRRQCRARMAGPIQLRCEYFVDPIGIDARRPRFSWQLDDPRRGARQRAYQVVVAGVAPALSKSENEGGAPSPQVAWDSGKVDSDQSIHVEYAGAPL